MLRPPSPPTWHTADRSFQTLLKRPPNAFTAKQGGAKNAGLRTGVYTFNDEKILIKQGDQLGETLAEYLGGNLYQLTMPHLAAPCILLRDKTQLGLMQSLYVGSIYIKGDKVQDAYKAAGYPYRPLFAGVKARVNSESLIRKLIHIDQTQANHSMAISAANSLWHGDSDFQSGNLMLIEKEGKKTFIRIDYGFSFFNFGKKIIDIFNPFAGKVVSFDLQRFLKGGKLIEFHPTNHFWDLAVESKSFYFHPSFIKACEDIIALRPEQIRRNIHRSLEKIKNTCEEYTEEALQALAKRINMPLSKHDLSEAIEDYMVENLIARQYSLQKLVNYCREKNALLSAKEECRFLSSFLNQKIIEHLDNPADPITLKLLKLLQQANDLSQLEVKDGKLCITDTFYFHYEKTEPVQISPQDFSLIMGITESPLLEEVADFLISKSPSPRWRGPG